MTAAHRTGGSVVYPPQSVNKHNTHVNAEQQKTHILNRVSVLKGPATCRSVGMGVSLSMLSYLA